MTTVSDRHEIKLGTLPWPDFVVIAEPSEYHVSFRVYEVIGTDGVGDDAPLLFHEKDWVSSPGDSVTDVERAEVYIEGSVKWDGCSNWTFGGIGHFCGRRDAVRTGELLDRLYTLAQEAMGGHVSDVAMFNGTPPTPPESRGRDRT